MINLLAAVTNNGNNLTEVGVGVTVAILIIDKVFGFVSNFREKPKSANGNNSNLINRNEFEKFSEKVQYKDTCIAIEEKNDEKFDNVNRWIGEIKSSVNKIDEKLDTVVGLIKKK